jgi:hypothetical protein
VVDGDTDGGGIEAGDTGGLFSRIVNQRILLFVTSPAFSGPSYLELSKGEATAGADTTVVLDGRASNNRPQLVDGAGSDGSSLCAARQPTGDLLSGLFSSSYGQNQSIKSISITLAKLHSPR